jgi:3-methyladenine DNA glycosylase Tag
MLSQIGDTVGSMADPYKNVMQAATKPRGDMNDPQHLMNLAQWASSNGDSAAAGAYMQQANRLADTSKADAKQLRKEQGATAMGNISVAMQQVLKDGGPNADARMQALQEAAQVQAAKYGMDGVAASNMGNEAQSAHTQLLRQENAMQTEERALADRSVLDGLEAAAAESPEKLAAMVKRETAKGNGSIVRQFETARIQYEETVATAEENAAKRGELSPEEKAKAAEFNISIEGPPPSTVRTAIKNTEVSKASQALKTEKVKTIGLTTVKSLLPTVLDQMGSSNWIWDSGKDDWIEDVIDDPVVLEAVAAYVAAQGTPEGPQVLESVRTAVEDYILATQGNSGASDQIREERAAAKTTVGDVTIEVIEE